MELKSYMERIEELENKIEDMKYEISELKHENSYWFIGCTTTGNGDYWDEYYTRLGHITEEAAEKWLEENGGQSDNPFDESVFPVSKEKYDLYGDWYYVRRIRLSIGLISKNTTEQDGEFYQKLEEYFTDLEEKIRQQIGMTYNFRHIEKDSRMIDE